MSKGVIRFRLEDDRPDLMEALREAGYEGEFWQDLRKGTEEDMARLGSGDPTMPESWARSCGEVVVQDSCYPTEECGKLVEYTWQQGEEGMCQNLEAWEALDNVLPSELISALDYWTLDCFYRARHAFAKGS